MPNRVIDPNYFNDAIAEFAFNYTWYPEKGTTVDELGRKIVSYDNKIIRGSLQPRESTLDQSTSGNTQTLKYDFYCRAIYRINIGDFIVYKNRYLHVDSTHDYDEWGVRQCSLTSVSLIQYKNLKEYIEYLNNEKIV